MHTKHSEIDDIAILWGTSRKIVYEWVQLQHAYIFLVDLGVLKAQPNFNSEDS